MNFIGIDIGTTSISGVVLNLEKKKVESTCKIKNNSWIESKYDWEKIQDVHSIIKIVNDLLNSFLSKFCNIKGIGITGQMHGILYLDKSGNVLSPLYTWQDNRSKLMSKNNLSYIDRILSETGCKIFSGYGLATHYYNLENKLVPKSTKYISTIADYISMNLCQKKVPVIDYNNAASLGFFDLHKLNFDYSSLDKIGVDYKILPEVVSSGSIIGNFKNICPVVCSTGDNQASILGSTKNVKESVNVNIGTGGQINVFNDKYVEIDGIEIRTYFGQGYIQLGATLYGGRAYALLETFFKKTTRFFLNEEINDIYDKMDEVDSILYGGKDRVKVDTRFEGTRADQSLRGSIKNISMDNFTPEGLIIGFQEGIAEELYYNYKIIENSLNFKPKQLVGAGNGIRKNKLIRFFLEKIFGFPVKLTKYTEETAVGAALTVVIGLGYIDSFLKTEEIIDYQ